MKRKMIALVIVIALSLGTLGIFAGCGDGKKEIRVAAHEGAYGKAFWVDVEKAFEEANPEYNVIVETGTAINTTISPRIESMDGTEPDVIYYGTNQQSGFAQQLLGTEKGKSLLLPLDDILDQNVPGESKKLKDKINPDFMQKVITDPQNFGGTYMLPLFYSLNGLYYNKNIVTGTPAKTWKEVKSTTVPTGSYAYAYPRGGYLDNQMYANMYSILKDDTAKWNAFLAMNNAAVYDEPKVATLFDDLAALSEVFPRGLDWQLQGSDISDVTNNTKSFYEGKYGYFVGGSFMGTEAADAGTEVEKLKGKIGFMPYPGVEVGDDRYVVGMGEQVYALKTGDSERETAAKKFISFLYSDVAVKAIAKGNAMVPVIGCVELAKAAGMDADTLAIFGVIDEPDVQLLIGSLPNKGNTTAGSGFGFKQAICFGMDVAMGVRAPYDDNKPADGVAHKGNAALWIAGIKQLCNQ